MYTDVPPSAIAVGTMERPVSGSPRGTSSFITSYDALFRGWRFLIDPRLRPRDGGAEFCEKRPRGFR